MQIIYFGHSSFKIKTKTASLVTDPYHKQIGFKFPKTRADICTISHSHPDHNNKQGIKNEDCFFIEGPGEYEVKEVMIKGIKSYHDNENGQQRGSNTIYLIQAEDINICHLGDLGYELSDKEIKELENVDVLLIPVGGIYTIDPKQAVKIIQKIDPSIVIPMHYKQAGLSSTFDILATSADFFKAMDMEAKNQERLSITASSLPEEIEVFTLDRKE
jgi:L-ascorbate metabolism protein UlaG (beta-lactamase superfamily)